MSKTVSELSEALKNTKFQKASKDEFFKALRSRVKDYFESSGKTKYADARMKTKTVVILFFYFVPLIFVYLDLITSIWGFLGLYTIMGIAKAGIGMSVMHDANHGAYSKSQKVNDRLGVLMNWLGSNAINWKIQHNVLHHTYTNVDGLDGDLDSGIVLRLSPDQKRYWFHKYQFIYAWFLYGLMTIMRVTTKEYGQLNHYFKLGLTKKFGSKKKIFSQLILWKLFYYTLFLAGPLYFSSFSTGMIVLNFFIMHYITGFILSCIFQLAHVMDAAEFPKPNNEGQLEDSWAALQLKTTVNFAHKNRLLSWYIGGLNYQIEHHLFPSICHIHYRDLSKIVKETALEYNLPYHEVKSFSGAMWIHLKALRSIASAPQIAEA